jgi:hypothetical protein
VGCEFLDNVAAAGYGGGLAGLRSTVSIRETVFARNWAIVYGNGSGLYLGSAFGRLSNCTVVENVAWSDNDALEIWAGSAVDIDHLLIANNTGGAMICWDSQVHVACSNLYGNSAGDTLCGTDVGGNFSADPLFCDLDAGDYTLDADSPCLPGQHPDGADCGLIGAFGEGCGGSTPVETSSWGRIKELYRRR